MLTGEVKPLDNLVSFDDLMSEIYDPYPDARQLKPSEQYQKTAESRKFPSFGRYGVSTRYADRLPYMPQVAYLPVLDIEGLEQDFRGLPRLRRIANPPSGIPKNREYVHGKGTDDDRAKKPRIDAQLSNLKMYNEKFEECLPAIREMIGSEGATIARQLGEGGSGTAYYVCSTEEAAIEGNPCKFVVKFFSPGDDTFENETEILEELQDVPMMERHEVSWQPYPAYYGSGKCKQKRKYADGTVKYEDIGFVVLEALDPNPYSEDFMPVDKEHEWLDTVNYLEEQGFRHNDTHAGNLVYRDGKPVIIDWGLAEQWKKKAKDLDLFYPRYDNSASKARKSLDDLDEPTPSEGTDDEIEGGMLAAEEALDSLKKHFGAKADGGQWPSKGDEKFRNLKGSNLEKMLARKALAVFLPTYLQELKSSKSLMTPDDMDHNIKNLIDAQVKYDGKSSIRYVAPISRIAEELNIPMSKRTKDSASLFDVVKEWVMIAESGNQDRTKKVMKKWQRFFSDNNQKELADYLASKGYFDEVEGGSTYKQRAARRFKNFMNHKVVSKKQVKKFL
jgi:hypothetical protein